MASLAGQAFPEDVSFLYIPYSPDKAGLNSCGLPIKYEASKGTQLMPSHKMLLLALQRY